MLLIGAALTTDCLSIRMSHFVFKEDNVFSMGAIFHMVLLNTVNANNRTLIGLLKEASHY